MAVESKTAQLTVNPGIGKSRLFDLSYLESVRDSDDLVVFLPGMGLDATDFEPYLTTGDTHAIAVNLVGFDIGLPRRTRALSLDLHVRLVSAFLAHLQSANVGKRLSLAGFSLGADLVLRLGEFWRDQPNESTALSSVLLLDPNVNHSTMTISTIFARADPHDPVPVLKSVLQMPSDQHELGNVCTYIAKIAKKDFAAISQYAKEFVNYWEPPGRYDLIASRLTNMGKFTEHLRVVLSAAYEPHLETLRRAMGGSDLFDMTKLDHFDLIAAEQLEQRLGRARVTGAMHA